jgi:hypothetical protein
MDGVSLPLDLSECKRIDEGEINRTCERCGKMFVPRSQSGGKPQRFCSNDCRSSFHKEAQRSQRSPTCTLPKLLPAVIEPPKPENAPRATPEPSGEFDWSSDDSIVLHHQPAVAVYINEAGGLTIRQERNWDEDQDTIIAIAPESVSEFIDKLTDLVVPSVGK